jgi:curved DNA-binding protein CbpA
MLNLQVGATFAEVRPAYDGLFDDMERRQKTATAAQKAAIELEQKEVNKAYDMIGDEVRKSVYDHELWSLGLWPGAEPEMLVYVDEIDEQDELDHYAGDETIEIEDGLYEILELPRGSLHSLVHPQYLKQLDIWLNFLDDPNISQQERDGATQCVKVLKKARGILGDKQRKFNHDVELANAGLLGGEAVYGDDTETDRDELEAWIDTSAAFGGVPEGEDEEEAEGQYEEEVVEMVEGHGEGS